MSRSDNAPADAEYSLLLLGPASLVDASGNVLPGMGPGKPLAMLAYLAIRGSAQRDELVGMLWPEMPEGRARNAFRQTLHRLRNALGQKFLATDRETISVVAEGGLWCDAVEFQDAVSVDVDRAITLYRGPFLGSLNVGSAPFEQWVEAQRDRMDAQYRGALTRAANTALEAGEPEKAVGYANALSQAAPLDSAAAMLEAKTLVAAGRKPEAISVLTQHVASVESELGSKPSAAVSAMLHRMVNETPAAAAPPATGADLLPESEFVGRDRELGKLLGLWRAIEQRGAFASVTGPPGIGKTRLLKELTQRMTAFGPALIFWGQERHGNRAIPYAALADALRPAVNAPGVAGASQHLLAEAARLLPEIRDQFNLPEARPLEDDAARIRFFEGVAALLDAVAFEQPVCVVLEDLQHASRSSAELLQFLTQRLAAAPILFLVSYRPEDAPRYVLERFGAAGLAADAGAPSDNAAPVRSLLSLGPLSVDTTKRLVASVTAPGELGDDGMASIASVSEGNPFRALDLVRRVRRGEPLAKPPAELSAILWARLQACAPQEQRLFLACALLGRPAPLRVLAAATHLAEPVAFDAALVLEQCGLTIQRNGGVAPAHDVVALLALEGTGSAGRALLAGWTADALAAEPGTANAELAQLYAAAGQPSSAHDYARAAILDAAANGAAEELDNLLVLAAQTALNNRDRMAVESLRTAFRGGATRLRSGENVSGAAARAEQKYPSGEKSVEESRPPAAAETARGRPLGAFQWLVASRKVQVIASLLVVAAVSAFLVQGRIAAAGSRGTALSDSVAVAERVGARGTRQYLVTGSIMPDASLTEAPPAPLLPWISELTVPWVNARVSPDGRHVAVEQVTPRGTDVYVMDASGRDTIPLAVAAGDELVAGWSPDGQWLLVIHGTSEESTYRSELHAYLVAQPGVKVPLDIDPAHIVMDAVWSPTGLHVAWTARTGATRQQDVFVSMGDGSGGRKVTNSEGEDYRPAWSPDGERLVFTSDRDGDAELYTLELRSGELRRLTFDPAQEDHAEFSPSGDFIAFESTRGGQIGVYVMPSLGGNARRLTPPERSFELLGWRGRPPGYVAELRAAAPATLAVGGRAALTVTALDQRRSPLATPPVEWSALDDAVELIPLETSGDDDAPSTVTMVAKRPGVARIVARAGTWRADTAFTLVGTPLTLVSDDFSTAPSPARWTLLGDPLPAVVRDVTGGGSALVLRSDRQWESGVLGTTVFPLRPGISLRVRVRAPFSSEGRPGGFTLALVAAEAGEAIDPSAPQFLKIAALSWLSDAGRMAYSADREFWSEAVRFTRDDWHSFRIDIEADGRAAFYVENVLRRRSSIVLTGKDDDVRVQLWLGGRATGDDVAVDMVELRVQ